MREELVDDRYEMFMNESLTQSRRTSSLGDRGRTKCIGRSTNKEQAEVARIMLLGLYTVSRTERRTRAGV